MIRPRKLWIAGIAAAVALAALGASVAAEATGGGRPTTGVGSCPLKNWNPSTDPKNAKDLPLGHRPMTYRPDGFDCTGAVFALPGVEFAKFPQPHDFNVKNRATTRTLRVCKSGTCTMQPETVWAPTAAVNPLAPYFPPFTHFVVIMRENHTFDDYLGDCATTIAVGCNGVVESTNHISSVPYLHALAKQYALSDSYSTGTQPPSGPNHWWLFTAQSASSSQQQSYPAATGSQFDQFLGGDLGPTSEGTNPCNAQSGSGSGGSPYTFMAAGDFYWMLTSGSGYWRNPATGNVEVLPTDRPGTTIPEELHDNEYTCHGQSIPDTTVATDYLNFVNANGLPAYNYVELFNDHPGTYQDIPTNDATTNQIVTSIMSNPLYQNNTLIVVTEDDTQNGNNGSDHVSNTYRVPLVVIGSPTYVKAHYISHVAYTTSNVLAAMERVMQNVHPGIINPNDALSLATFPMTTNARRPSATRSRTSGSTAPPRSAPPPPPRRPPATRRSACRSPAPPRAARDRTPIAGRSATDRRAPRRTPATPTVPPGPTPRPSPSPTARLRPIPLPQASRSPSALSASPSWPPPLLTRPRARSR